MSLGDNFYLIIAEISWNICKSYDKMLQLLQNHSVCHNTDSQHSSVSYLLFQVICGSIVMVRFQRLHDLKNNLNFYFFISGVQNNEDRKTLQAQTWLIAIKILPYTVLLNLKIVCHLGELNFITNYSKTSDFHHLILATVNDYQ